MHDSAPPGKRHVQLGGDTSEDESHEESKSLKAAFVAVKGRLERKPFALNEGQKVVMGRGEQADIQILDSSLSRLHCCITREDESFIIEDLESRNGTWVNGNQITRAHLLSGDRIKTGGIEFEFKVDEERRKVQACLIADVPERVEGAIREKLKMEQADLMNLSPRLETIENYRKVQQDLATIYKIGNLVHSEGDMSKLCELVMDAIFEVVDAERGFLILADDTTGRLSPVAAREGEKRSEEVEVTFSRTIVDESFSSGYSFLSADAMADDRFKEGESIMFRNIRSVMCAPVQTQDKTLGVIYVDTVTDSEAFAKHELELLTAIGKQAGIAIERAKLMEGLEKLFYGSVRTLVATIEAKDKYTFGHSERVTAYAMQIAEHLDEQDDILGTIQLAGLLHDIGKIGIKESILNKAGGLNEEEFADVRGHPAIGAKILTHIENIEDVARAVRHHHERYDGSGYPDGLRGEEIPYEARILAVADAFDAMTSRRPYRDTLSKDEVIEEFSSNKGTQFDPDIADVLLRLFDEDALRTPDSIYAADGGE